jgi:cation-transporting ATPase 13A3/4/5
MPICPIYDNETFYVPGDASPSVLQEAKKDRSQLMIEIMASCHSLTCINGKITGDALDKKMFEWTSWILEDNNENKFDQLILSIVKPKSANEMQDFDKVKESVEKNNFPNEIGVIRRFDFSSKLQRMSVIVRSLSENKFRLHVKGSPEVIRELCKTDSIPDNFHTVLNDYAKVCLYFSFKLKKNNLERI